MVILTDSEVPQTLFSKVPLSLDPGIGISMFMDRGSFGARLSDTQALAPETMSLADGRPHLLAFSRTAGRLLVSVDGRQLELHTYADILDVSDVAKDVVIGCNLGLETNLAPGLDVTCFQGEFAAIVATTGADGSRLGPNIEAYLMTTYGVSPP
jgi:hypothetical protein